MPRRPRSAFTSRARTGTSCSWSRDNGRGITEEEIQGHGSLGLLGMKERVELLGGTLELKGRPGEGTTLAIRMPIEAGRAS